MANTIVPQYISAETHPVLDPMKKIELYPGSSCILSLFAWCPCMAIDVSVQYDPKFLPEIVLLTICYHHRRTRLNAMRLCPYSL